MKPEFATCLNCIDGRVQLPAINWICQNSGAGYVDLITEPGMDRILADNDFPTANILKKLDTSIEKHDSKQVFIAGHADCAGNPVNKDEHIKQILQAVERIKRLRPLLSVIGIWISENWQVAKVAEG